MRQCLSNSSYFKFMFFFFKLSKKSHDTIFRRLKAPGALNSTYSVQYTKHRHWVLLSAFCTQEYHSVCNNGFHGQHSHQGKFLCTGCHKMQLWFLPADFFFLVKNFITIYIFALQVWNKMNSHSKLTNCKYKSVSLNTERQMSRIAHSLQKL